MVFQATYIQAYTNLSYLGPVELPPPLIRLLLSPSHPLNSSRELSSDCRQINPAEFIHVDFYLH